MIYASSSVKDCTTEQVGIVIGENETSQVSGHDNGEAAAEQHLLVEEGDGRPGGEGGHLHHQIQVGWVFDGHQSFEKPTLCPPISAVRFVH